MGDWVYGDFLSLAVFPSIADAKCQEAFGANSCLFVDGRNRHGTTAKPGTTQRQDPARHNGRTRHGTTAGPGPTRRQDPAPHDGGIRHGTTAGPGPAQWQDPARQDPAQHAI